jgi:hypothetical protein
LDKQYYQIVKNGKTMPVIPKAKITVLISPKFGVMAQYSGSVYVTVGYTDYSATPVQIPACSFPAPDSSVILASVFWLKTSSSNSTDTTPR